MISSFQKVLSRNIDMHHEILWSIVLQGEQSFHPSLQSSY
jgi:hypothetical protein